MAEAGSLMLATAEPGQRVPCPDCGRLVLVNQDGRLRHHFPEGGSWLVTGECSGSRQAAAYGLVRVLRLKDGVVVKVTHPAGTMADEAVTDELVMTSAEWAELMRLVAAEDKERFRGSAMYMEGVKAERIRCADLLRQHGQYAAADLVEGGEKRVSASPVSEDGTREH